MYLFPKFQKNPHSVVFITSWEDQCIQNDH